MVHGFNPPGTVTETTRFDAPRWYPYAESKIRAEKLIENYRKRGLDVVVLRPMIVVGPRSAYWAVSLARQIVSGQSYLVDGGVGRCNTVYIQHLLDAMLASAHHPQASNETFIVDDEFGLTWKDYYQELCKLLEYPFNKVGQVSRSDLCFDESGVLNWMRDIKVVARTALQNEYIKNWGKRAPGMQALESALSKQMKHKLESLLKQRSIREEGQAHLDRELCELQLYPHAMKSSNIRETLGWKPRFTLGETLQRTKHYFEFAELGQSKA